jgi:hypothetical protein
MLHGSAVHSVPLDAAGKTLALGSTADIYVVPGVEYINFDLLTDGKLGEVCRLYPNLSQKALWLYFSFFKLAAHGAIQPTLAHLFMAKLQGGIAIPLRGSDVYDDAGTGLDHRYRDRLARLVEDLRHSNLSPEQSFAQLFHLQPHLW